MEPANHPFRKEHDLTNLHDYVKITSVVFLILEERIVDGSEIRHPPVEPHYLQGFIHPRWLFGISAINSSTDGEGMKYIKRKYIKYGQTCNILYIIIIYAIDLNV